MDIRWNETGRKAWTEATSRAAWQQSWAYGEAWAGLYGPVHRAEIALGGETVAVAQVTARTILGHLTAATCTHGPVWLTATDSETRAKAYRLLRRSVPLPRLRGVFFTPDRGVEERTALRSARMRNVMTPYSTALIDLTRDEDALRGAMNGKWRNRLTRAAESGLRTIPAPAAPGQYGWLLELEAAQRRRRRYRADHPALTQAWQSHCTASDGALIVTAKQAARRVAAMLFLIHGRTALYHIGWSGEEGRRTGAHNLLLWDAMRRLKRKGIETLDLGGVDTVDHAGIARFKLGAGGKVSTLCGTWV